MIGTRRIAGLAVLAVLAVGVGGIALIGRPGLLGPATTVDPGGRDPGLHVFGGQGAGADAGLLAAVPIVRLATVAVSLPLLSAPAGDPILDSERMGFGIEPGWQVAVFDGPVVAGGDSWFRVYVLIDPSAGPAEFFGWMPLHDETGAETLSFQDPPICPDGRGISVLGALDPFTRARCIGEERLELVGWTWDRMLPTWYRITPEWMGEQNGEVDSTISLNEDARHQFNGVGPFPFLELQVPPALDRPPFEFEVRVWAHVADGVSHTCARRVDPFSLVPEDIPPSGALWCTTRLVVDQWAPINGPEQRPIDPSAPQLHRHPKAGPNTGCAGVGMPPLVFHMDPTQLDPVWLEANGMPPSRIIPNFDPGFRVVGGANMAIVDAQGQLVARNGTPVDPDGQLAGHSICPTGPVVYFD